MARHVFLGDREWCTRGYHLCIRRLSTKRRTVSEISLLVDKPGDESCTKPHRHLATENTNISRAREGNYTTRIPAVGPSKQWGALQSCATATTGNTPKQRKFAESTHQLTC